ncbi:MAG: hypothetical protein QNJ19_08675 [Woeseiaceae bacterium]|nr:hypothetical protein [Woeseiaceae bacterium]
MKIVKPMASVVVIAVAGFFVWNYFAGPLKYRRDMQSFADLVENCEAGSLAINAGIGGGALEHTVEGRRDDRCAVRMDITGPYVIRCAFPVEQLSVLAQGFSDLGKAVGIFGGATIRISTSNPDPLTKALNSDACETIEE